MFVSYAITEMWKDRAVGCIKKWLGTLAVITAWILISCKFCVLFNRYLRFVNDIKKFC